MLGHAPSRIERTKGKVMRTLNDWAKAINEWAVRKEWRGPKATPRELAVDIALWHSEASEALEEIRKVADPKHVWFSYTIEVEHVKIKNLTAKQVAAITGAEPAELGLTPKPEGFGPEAADLIIRILETMEEYGLDPEFEVARKMDYNEGREIRHGGMLM